MRISIAPFSVYRTNKAAPRHRRLSPIFSIIGQPKDAKQCLQKTYRSSDSA